MDLGNGRGMKAVVAVSLSLPVLIAQIGRRYKMKRERLRSVLTLEGRKPEVRECFILADTRAQLSILSRKRAVGRGSSSIDAYSFGVNT